MGAQAAHGLGFPLDALAAGVVEPLGLDQREGYVAVEERVVGQVDAFLAPSPRNRFTW
jgi:hypothetical protein